MGQSSIVIKGAREHNLKNVDVEIPRDELVVITGLSGSGKARLLSTQCMLKGSGVMWKSIQLCATVFGSDEQT